MKSTIYTVLLALFSISVLHAQSSIEGKVTDANTGKPIHLCSVTLIKNDKRITETKTDIYGYYRFSNIDPGSYDVEAQYVGYGAIQHTGIITTDGKVTRLDILLFGGHLEDIEITEYEIPLIELDNTTSGSTITAEKIRSLPTKAINAMATSVSGIKSSDGSRISMRSTRSYDTEYYVDGVRTSSIRGIDKSTLPESGQITAGEWNDLHNWKDWMALLEEENYSIMTERYQIYPTRRYSVLVVNENNAVMASVPVKLLDQQGNTIWQTFTDNSGKAELWEGAYGEDATASTILVKGQKIDDIVTIDEGSNTVVLSDECYSPDQMDIAFVVDATSSMNDEINYLKSELLDVISRIEATNNDIDFNLGSVFYRDTNDEYLTRAFPFTPDVNELVEFVGNQYSSGGGDKPEAVDAALEEALKLNWREDALKLIFLVLDAPPHEDEATMDKIRAQVKEAAERGIKLIPITASGIDRNTEFLMKFMAILTNGTYVFITDHSGIGNPHLDPVVEDYEVEKLNDCMVRLIVQYSKSFSCDAEIKNVNEEMDLTVYPNPSSQFINVRTNQIADKIKVYSSNGMVVMTIKPTEKNTRIELGDLVNGIYTVSVIVGDKVENKQIILLK